MNSFLYLYRYPHLQGNTQDPYQIFKMYLENVLIVQFKLLRSFQKKRSGEHITLWKGVLRMEDVQVL